MTVKLNSDQVTNEDLEVRTREREVHRNRRDFDSKRKEKELLRGSSRKADTRLRGTKQSRKKRISYDGE